MKVETRDGISSIGNRDILTRKKLAFFCSVKCPGDIILKIFDLAQTLRNSDMVVISGFHSPMEREVHDLLLRSERPLIVCPARSLEGMRIRSEYKTPLSEGRLLLLSPFDRKQNRMTAKTSQLRNEMVADLADQILIAHASPGGKMEKFCHRLLDLGKHLFTLASPANHQLVNIGARAFESDEIGNIS